jgi:hypothetical protein
MSDDRKLTFEWVQQPDGSRALVFDAKTWAVFEAVAKDKGKGARHMISAAASECLGAVVMDNYVRGRQVGVSSSLGVSAMLRRECRLL